MKMPNTPVQAAGEAMPKTTWNASIDFNRHSLKRLSIKDLATFTDAMTLCHEAAKGIYNQPRCTDKVRDQLEQFNDFLDNVIEMAGQIARDYVPETREQASERAYLLMRQETFYTDDFTALADTFTQLKADMEPFLIEGAR
jgi:hypothetical protein